MVKDCFNETLDCLNERLKDNNFRRTSKMAYFIREYIANLCNAAHYANEQMKMDLKDDDDTIDSITKKYR